MLRIARAFLSCWLFQDEWGDQPAAASSSAGMMDEDEEGAGGLDASEERQARANAEGLSSRAVVDFDPNRERQIILHEDKQYYPDAEQVRCSCLMFFLTSLCGCCLPKPC